MIDEADEGEDVTDIVVEDDLVGEDVEVVEDVVNLDVDNVVYRLDLENVEQEVGDLEREVVVVERVQEDEDVVGEGLEYEFEVVDVEYAVEQRLMQVEEDDYVDVLYVAHVDERLKKVEGVECVLVGYDECVDG